MEFDYEFGDGPFDLIVTVRGLADVGAFLGGQARLAADPRIETARNALIDESQVDGSRFAADDVRQVAEDAARRFGSLGLENIAIVVPGPLVFGLTRMWQSIAGGSLEERSTVVGSVDEAYAWLARRS